MYRSWCSQLLAAVLVLSSLAQATDLALSVDSRLSESYSIMKGDWVAWQLSQRLLIENIISNEFPPAYVQYDRNSSSIVVSLYGQRGTVEGAREIVSGVQQYIAAKLMPDVRAQFGIPTQSSDFAIVYFDRSARGGPREVVRLERDQFLVPPQGPPPPAKRVGL
jgi:hypothetical protein